MIRTRRHKRSRNRTTIVITISWTNVVLVRTISTTVTNAGTRTDTINRTTVIGVTGTIRTTISEMSRFVTIEARWVSTTITIAKATTIIVIVITIATTSGTVIVSHLETQPI